MLDVKHYIRGSGKCRDMLSQSLSSQLGTYSQKDGILYTIEDSKNSSRYSDIFFTQLL